MVKVLVNGAQGRMGKEAVEAILADPMLDLVGGIDKGDDLAASIDQLKPHVVVDFTVASAGFENTLIILKQGVCPVIGTSGFQKEQVAQLQQLASDKQVGGLIAPNFSVGAVLMMKFAAEAARYMPDAEVIEAHSPQKQESPSGTALRTAELIAEGRRQSSASTSDKELLEGARGASLNGVPLHAIRLPGIVAQQTVFFGGTGETLKIEHNSQNRQSFMPGVCLACREIVKHKQLVFGLEHLLDA